MAAGRTDRGVHATGQVASALIPARFEARELHRALNSIAPRDIWVESIERVADAFHPRYDATSRTYVYRVGITAATRSPFVAAWCWPLARPLDREQLDAAAGFIVGENNFELFAKSGQPQRGTRCRVRVARWRESAWRDGVLEFEITADRYLHHMVRYLVGVMVDIGRGRRQLDEIERLIRGESGPRAPAPAPPQGLFLTEVEYTKQVQATGMEAQGDADEDIC